MPHCFFLYKSKAVWYLVRLLHCSCAGGYFSTATPPPPPRGIPQRGAILPDYELKSGKTAPLLLTPLIRELENHLFENSNNIA